MNKMFCFQCEQSAKCQGCTIQGVCGKTADTANLQDDLTSALIEFATCADVTDKNTDLIIEGLFTTITNVNFDDESIKELKKKIENKIPINFILYFSSSIYFSSFVLCCFLISFCAFTYWFSMFYSFTFCILIYY